ncbi:MAG: D-glycerate dehydrogenase [Pirellulales bacterium]|nr:D-glycerate dehydrogenase [Pirellulales bacterium]
MHDELRRVAISFPLPGLEINTITADERLQVWVNPSTEILSRETLLAHARGAHGVLVTPGDGPIDDAWMQAAGDSLRVISCFSVGVDYVDLAAAGRRQILVGNTPGATTEPTADITWLLLLGAARNIRRASNTLETGWTGIKPDDDYGLRLVNQTLLVIGAGQIGTAVARRATGWGMRILYVARSLKTAIEADPICATRVTLEEGLAQADIISLHVPLTAETTHMIAKPQLDLMKRTAVLINTSRGAVVDESALIDALEKRRIHAAGIDVYENEPVIPPRLMRLNNAFLLPHIGTATHDDRSEMTHMATENLLAGIQGRRLPYAVSSD